MPKIVHVKSVLSTTFGLEDDEGNIVRTQLYERPILRIHENDAYAALQWQIQTRDELIAALEAEIKALEQQQADREQGVLPFDLPDETADAAEIAGDPQGIEMVEEPVTVLVPQLEKRRGRPRAVKEPALN